MCQVLENIGSEARRAGRAPSPAPHWTPALYFEGVGALLAEDVADGDEGHDGEGAFHEHGAVADELGIAFTASSI